MHAQSRELFVPQVLVLPCLQSTGHRYRGQQRRVARLPEKKYFGACHIDRRKWSTIAASGRRLPQVVDDCRKWSTIAASGRRLPQVVDDCRKWSTIAAMHKARRQAPLSTPSPPLNTYVGPDSRSRGSGGKKQTTATPGSCQIFICSHCCRIC